MKTDPVDYVLRYIIGVLEENSYSIKVYERVRCIS